MRTAGADAGRDAVAEARRVVGLYGDPTASWSILIEARLRARASSAQVRDRLAALVGQHPHLGLPPDVLSPDEQSWDRARADFADRPYTSRQPLIRVAVGERAPRLLLAAHHGAVDGFGLLALLGAALDAPVRSGAAGLGERPARHGFLTSAALRLGEALWAPPGRVAGQGGAAHEAGDALAAADWPAGHAGHAGSGGHVGSAGLVAATARAVRRWNRRHGVPSRRIVAALGASRRPGAQLAPDRRTAFLRLRLGPRPELADVQRLLAETPPEPDFPGSGSRLPRLAIRALSHRLGATFLASHLGVVATGGRMGTGDSAGTSGLVESLAFYPTASGRHGLAVGAATCGDTTTVTARARRTGFNPTAAQELLTMIAEEATR
ncbi:MAG: hypothetical protein GEU94_18085 [Micromonosporaceae bacterium]|nr:hypothetical protein [Micromonosporaceae bacterium]